MSPALLLSLLALALSGCKLAWMYAGSKNELSTINPVPWMIWGMLSVAMIAAQVVEAGWEWALLFSVGNATLNWLVVWVAHKHNWPRLTLTDWLAIGIALLGVVMWARYESASDGMKFFLAADAVGAVLMVIKVWKDPWHERRGTWVFGVAAAAAAYLSARYATDNMVGWYPKYVIGNSLLILGALLIRRVYVSRPVVEVQPVVAGEVA